MSMFDSLRHALIEQTREIQNCIEQEDTRLLLKCLKRRSTLLHKLNTAVESSPDVQEKVAARELIVLLQEMDQRVQSDLIEWQQSISQQRQQQWTQRRVAHAYRQPAPIRCAMIVT